MLNRREFLRTSAFGAGAVIATSHLPALGDVAPSAFIPSDKGLARMSLSYQRIHIGLPQPFSVLHISDTHLTECYPTEPPHKVEFAAKRTRGFGGRQVEALRNSIAWAKGNADLLVHTGDLIDFQTEANLDFVRKMFGEEKNIAASVGNHEYQRRKLGEPIVNTAEYSALSKETLSAAYPFDISLQSTVSNGVNFVTMSQVFGVVSESQVERFAAEVKKGLPIVLCMHVPLFTEHIWLVRDRFRHHRWSKFRISGPVDLYGDYKNQMEDKTTRDFVAYLKSEPLLKGILAGHLHTTVQDRFSPTAMEYVVGGNYMFHGQGILFT